MSVWALLGVMVCAIVWPVLNKGSSQPRESFFTDRSPKSYFVTPFHKMGISEDIFIFSPAKNEYQSIASKPVVNLLVSEVNVYRLNLCASERMRSEKEIPLVLERGCEIEV